METWGTRAARRPRLWLSPCLPGAGKDPRASSYECLPTADRAYPQLPASALHKRTGANCCLLVVVVFLSSGGQSSLWVLAAGGLCCRSSRSALLEKHQLGGSCCYFPDNCTHCAASVASKVSPCLCRDSSSWERGLLTRGEEVGRRRKVLQPPLLFTCSVFMLESKCTWLHMHVVPGVSLAAAPP